MWSGKNFFLTVILALCMSGEAFAQELFDIPPFQLEMPKKWKLHKNYTTGDDWEYYFFKRKGFFSSGLVVIKWKNDTTSLEDNLIAHLNKVKSSFTHFGGHVSNTEIYDSKFNDVMAKRIDYNGSALGVKQSGNISTFKLCGMTVFWMEQVADEEYKSNQPGRKVFRTSFRCK